MTTKAAFSPEEWEVVLEGPPAAGLMVITAAHGGTFRETIAMSKAYAETRAEHGDSELLDEAELRGVLGHELAHVSGHDLPGSSLAAGLATAITFPASLARLTRRGSAGSGSAGSGSAGSGSAGSGGPAGPASSGLGALEHALMLVFGPVAAVIVRLAVSQEREYRADATGALLSGDPVALAGALRKIDAGTAELALAPDGRRVSVGHLMIASPFRPEGVARLFRTHPPAGERVRRLEALAGYRR